ncbi:hypothetical protein DDJ31_02775 [Streptomyces griseoviridis]|uniref:Uncharacterized protein n=1 Tax=Streptomyces griseoviridis TaxID=45398 RepID=A0ABX5TQT3_STRGD|nr:hypothetical protein DDJ31_02775 [Streptomyces griseoviridis]
MPRRRRSARPGGKRPWRGADGTGPPVDVLVGRERADPSGSGAHDGGAAYADRTARHFGGPRAGDGGEAPHRSPVPQRPAPVP